MGRFVAITPYYNPLGWLNRRRNYLRFAASLAGQGVELWTAEAAAEGQAFDLPPAKRLIQFRGGADPLWQKERLLNLLIAHLPRDVDKVAWLDCDILFEDPCWARKAANLLEGSPLIQLYSKILYLGADGRPLSGRAIRPSMMADRQSPQALPGGAWAARRELLERHPFPDYLIAGAGDMPVCMAASGKTSYYHQRLSPAVVRKLLAWEKRFAADVRGKATHLAGTISHLWHGSREKRQYATRYEPLQSHGFDPDQHLVASPSGLWTWSEAAPAAMRESLAEYFRSREEDEGVTAPPAITAMMVTRGTPERRRLAVRSLAAFLRQTHPRKELVIVNEGDAPVLTGEALAELAQHGDIGLLREAMIPGRPKLPLGQLRNIGLDLATTDAVLPWDDDDVAHPERMARMAELWMPGSLVIQRREVHICAKTGERIVADAERFTGGGFHGSLLFDRTLARYPDKQLGEDTTLLRRLMASGARRFVFDFAPWMYLRFHHGGNICSREHFFDKRLEQGGRGLTAAENRIVDEILPTANSCGVYSLSAAGR